MVHRIKISTIEALTVNKALKMDLGNELDNEIATRLIEKINKRVSKDLKNLEKEQTK